MTPAHISNRICTIDGCGRKHRAKGFCDNHYALSNEPKRIKRGYYRSDSYKTRHRKFMRTYCLTPIAALRGKASKEVQRAIRKGTLTPLPCERCSKKAQAHHDSYEPSKWLDVRWLCTKHHAEWHKKNTPIFPQFV